MNGRPVAWWVALVSWLVLAAFAFPQNAGGQGDGKAGLSEFIRQRQSKWIDSGWTGRLANGRTLSAQELSDTVSQHELWLKTDKAQGARADLTGAALPGAYLAQRNLAWAVRKGVDLSGANLFGALMIRADLAGSRLYKTDLMYAKMLSADLAGAKLTRADLSNADLSAADLRAADLSYANLRSATLQDANLDGSDLMAAQGLTELRKQFKESGAVSLAKQLTYQIRRTDRVASWHEGIFGKVDSVFNLVVFEIPCKYGYNPGRALAILLLLIPLFAIPYIGVLLGRTRAYIWRVHKIGDEEKRMTLSYRAPGALATGMYFSVLSAFEIDWKEFTVSSWIKRLQTSDYSLESSGWVRSISGIQSLISVYLLALWALTYFGSPFE